jgi:hypothetical protein|tara:strand:- start:273 stop:869 length:597 start_codon:yes stop_codon:yes gene_type:complete
MAVARIGPGGLPLPLGGITGASPILEGGGGYMGPPRFAPGSFSTPTGIAGLVALYNKIFNPDMSKTSEEEITDEEGLTDEERKLIDEAPEGMREYLKKQLLEIKSKKTGDDEELKEGIRQKIIDDLITGGVDEDVAEQIAASSSERAFEKMREGLSPKDAMEEAFGELIKLQQGVDTRTSTKQAKGGLVGINDLIKGI